MIYLFVILLVLVLNPYTIIGPLAYYVALPFLALTLFHGAKYLQKSIVYAFLICIAISFVGVLSSILHDIAQFEHLKVALSIFVYYLVGIGLFIVFKNSGKSTEDLLFAALLVVVVNGVVILMQVQMPLFRSLVESFFVESGNIDWKEGFRFRGLAAGGGASLSILAPVGVYIAMYLYGVKKIQLYTALLSIIILISSVFFIGRTGLLLLPVALLLYLFSQGGAILKNAAIWGGIFFIIILLGFEYISEFLVNQFGEGFYKYSIGYFLEGREGFRDEGTAETVLAFLAAVPQKFPEILIGYGFYGGSDFSPWTDSGYARMFLSVGYLFGLGFYACALFIFRKSAASKISLFAPIILILMISEVKEGLLFAGYSSRLLFILLGFWAAERLSNIRIAKNGYGFGAMKSA